jgi:ABC-2 type transport system ATP-binding protein
VIGLLLSNTNRSTKKNWTLITANKEQVIEVEFDYKIEEQAIAKMPHLKSYKNTHDFHGN